MLVIPAIDLINGQCVRLEQGAYDRQSTYHKDPLVVAKMFEDNGITHLHLVDLDGAKASRVINWKVLEDISKSTNLIIDWGGGIKSEKDLEIVFDNGANQATVGSIAAEKPELFHVWLNRFSPDKIILGADLKNGKVATRGWQETMDISWEVFLEQHLGKGIHTVISTDVSRDGMLAGPAIHLYRSMLQTFPEIRLIASGGISSMVDLEELRESGCFGAIIGKAIYEHRISLEELKTFV